MPPDKHDRTVFSGIHAFIQIVGPHLAVTVPQQHPLTSQHHVPCNMTIPMAPLLNMSGHMVLATPPQ
ncbi:hypothetical protein E2C01_102278 [Portunus trituberculatus]|uniref:Uncharacterized protein n=1 Tax=Portunus trituberculatus TaxID=210409 RepID=A0A5B7KHY3_PORTR|nr:hypothetical protein [Portunus trituberculatus]